MNYTLEGTMDGVMAWLWQQAIDIILYLIFQRPMISLEEAALAPSPLEHAAEDLLKHLFRKFLLLLVERGVNYSVLPREREKGRASTSVLMVVEVRGRQVDVFCRLSVHWPETQKMLNISIDFKISRIAGRELFQLPHRTRIELIAALAQLNRLLAQQRSPLTLAFDHCDSFIFAARSAFLPSQTKGDIKRAAIALFATSLTEFLKYFEELSNADLLESNNQIKKMSSLRQILERLYVSKVNFAVKSPKQEKSLQSCLSFLQKRTSQHYAAFNKLNQITQCLSAGAPPNEQHKVETIANAIAIIKKDPPHPAMQMKLQHNLQKNEAVMANAGIISLSKVTFQLRKSFGRLRHQPNSAKIIHHHPPNYKQSNLEHQEHLVLKRCLPSNNSLPSQHSSNESTEHSNPKKSQSESGHENQHNFLMVNGDLKCPYIGKYYLDIGEGDSSICNRTIMTRFQKGDLFTEVAYPSHYRRYDFTLMEYLTIFEQLGEAIAFLHENRIIHRDIKPTNVLFHYHCRNRLLCKVIDFGSCYLLTRSNRHLFNPKVFTTARFNLTYRQANKQTADTISHFFTQDEYETHELFDIYGIAETVSYLLQSSNIVVPWLDVIIGICKHPNPNFRFTPDELLAVIGHMKVHLRLNQARLHLGAFPCFQNN